MGQIANTITSPFGVKLFSGGPYADRGMGDKQLAQGEKMGKIGEDLLSGFGGNMNQLMSLMSQLSGLPGFGGGGAGGGGMGGGAGLVGANHDWGAAGAFPGFGGSAPNGRMPGGTGGGRGFDPFGLAPHQEQAQNLFADQMNQGRQSALSQAQHGFNQRGITDPRASAALMARTNMGANQAIAGNRQGLMNNAFDTRMNTLSSLQDRIFNMGQMGVNLMGGQSDIYGQSAQRATTMSDNAMDSLGSVLGFAGANPNLQNFFKSQVRSPTKKRGTKIKGDYGTQVMA